MVDNTIYLKDYEKYKNVNIEVAIAFLLVRDWTWLEKNEKFIVLQSPDYMTFKHENNIYFPNPEKKEEAMDYGLVMGVVLNRIAQIYEMDKDELFKLWTKDSELFKREAESAIKAIEILKKSA